MSSARLGSGCSSGESKDDVRSVSDGDVAPWEASAARTVATCGDECFLTGLPSHAMPVPWRMLIQGNGSPTILLGLITGHATRVHVLEMAHVEKPLRALDDVQLLDGPYLRRQVFLENTAGERLGWAVSWWSRSCAASIFEDSSLPIWTSLRRSNIAVRRVVKRLYCVRHPTLASGFGHRGPFWGRHYVFEAAGRPLAVIMEVFSPTLCKYLGAQGNPDVSTRDTRTADMPPTGSATTAPASVAPLSPPSALSPVPALAAAAVEGNVET